MKQYRITTENMMQDSADDCYLAPEDPIHELKAATVMGGLGAHDRIHALTQARQMSVIQDNRAQTQRELGIEPGTEAWFKLWFGRKTQ